MLPTNLRPLLSNRAAGNFAWLVADRGIRLTLGLFVASWTARYLGPENFGLLNYALSLSTIFASIAPLGLEGIAVREIIWNRAQAGSYIGTAIALRSACALVCSVGSILLVAALRAGDSIALLLVSILSVGMLGQSLEYAELLFRADNKMPQLVIPRLGLFFVLTGVKVLLVLRGMSVQWFALLTAIEQIAGGGLTFVLLRRYAPGMQLSVAWSRGKQLLRECWPLALMVISIVIYMKAGQLVIGGLLGDRALGLYSAAIKIPESAYFLPTALASSLLPSLLARLKAGRDAYEVAVLLYMRISVCIGLGICVPLTLGSTLIVRLLFAREYVESAAPMALYSWTLPFIFLGVARTQCLLNDRKNALTLIFSVVGLVSNLVLNFALIPLWGIMGAATATVVSQVLSSVVANWLVPATRQIARQQFVALLTPWRVKIPAPPGGVLSASLRPTQI